MHGCELMIRVEVDDGEGDEQKTDLCKQTATTMTMNSPDSLRELYHAAAPTGDAVGTAELMREVGLKCIGFNGVSDASLSPPLPPLVCHEEILIEVVHRSHAR